MSIINKYFNFIILALVNQSAFADTNWVRLSSSVQNCPSGYEVVGSSGGSSNSTDYSGGSGQYAGLYCSKTNIKSTLRSSYACNADEIKSGRDVRNSSKSVCWNYPCPLKVNSYTGDKTSQISSLGLRSIAQKTLLNNSNASITFYCKDDCSKLSNLIMFRTASFTSSNNSCSLIANFSTSDSSVHAAGRRRVVTSYTCIYDK